MKTLKQWEAIKDERTLEQFIGIFGRIDELLYHHINNAYTSPRFSCERTLDGVRKIYCQASECETEIDGVRYYSTTMMVDDKCYFLGSMPKFKQAKSNY